jgi:cell division septation protein DedD
LEARVKERLTGAIILVALLVLLVPELLTGPESRPPPTPAGVDGAQLRRYTIDLKDAANGQPPPPTAPTAAVAEDPVGEAESSSPPTAEVSPPVDEAARAQGRPMGSGADVSAAAPEAPTPEPAKPAGSARSAEGSPSSADDRPRSAFGPNARPQPVPSASAAKPSAAPTSSEAAKASAAKADAQRAEAAKADAQKAEAARLAAAKAESVKPPPAAKPEGSKGESAKAGGSKGWAVQLGVFGSRDNAERLAKQVKGSGFPVLLNETSGKDGKKLYWVRVGPEADQAAATALSGRLKAAGHKDARVVAYP